MPRIRPGMKKPPPGFEIINDTLDTFEEAMKLALQEESTGVVGKTTFSHGSRESSSLAGGKHRRVEGVREESKVNDGENDEVKDLEEHSQIDHSVEHSLERVPPLWRIAQVNRERTRYVFDAFYHLKIINKEVYDYCCEMQFIDEGLARRWRLPGYEQLCCTACAVPGAASVAASITSKYALRDKREQRRTLDSSQQKKENNSTCICRVPISQRKNKRFFACTVCGCRGCCSIGTLSQNKKSEGQEKSTD